LCFDKTEREKQMLQQPLMSMMMTSMMMMMIVSAGGRQYQPAVVIATGTPHCSQVDLSILPDRELAQLKYDQRT
jgi:hypothetical protein